MLKTELEQVIKNQAVTIQNLTDKIKLLREQNAYLMQKRYGKSSEQVQSGQVNLFKQEVEINEDDEDIP